MPNAIFSRLFRGVSDYTRLTERRKSEGAFQFGYTKQTGEEILTNRDIEGMVVRSAL